MLYKCKYITQFIWILSLQSITHKVWLKQKRIILCYNGNMTALIAANTAALELQLHLHAYIYFYTIQQRWLILFWTFKMCNINMYTNTRSYWPSWSNILESNVISLEFHLFTRSTIGQLLYNTHYLCTYDCCDMVKYQVSLSFVIMASSSFRPLEKLCQHYVCMSHKITPICIIAPLT